MNTTEIIKDILPWLGTALGGPLGGIAAGFIGDKLGLKDSTVESVKNVLAGMSPKELQDMKDADHEFQLKMNQAGIDNIFKLRELDVRADENTGATMRAEAAAEHWPSYSWRPFLGATGGGVILWNYAIGPLFHYTPVPIPAEVWMFLTAVLGVASFFRGKAQNNAEVQTVTTSQKG
jgi:hypothetical protein